jgi:DNA-binding FadR family transcriptional regulator
VDQLAEPGSVRQDDGVGVELATRIMEFTGADALPGRTRIASMVRAVRPLLVGVDLDARDDEWDGARPRTTDGVPLVGPDPYRRGLCRGRPRHVGHDSRAADGAAPRRADRQRTQAAAARAARPVPLNAGGYRATVMAPDRSRRVPSELFQPVTTRAAFEAVMRQIADLVDAGHLHEGDALPGERILAAAMQVSRPTIRLAVGTLVDAGVLEVAPGRGGGIRIRSRWFPDDLRGRTALELNAEQLFALLEARRTLEPRVAQIAAVRGSTAQFEAMRDAVDLQEQCVDDRPKAIQAELHFHRLLWRAAGNDPLESMLVRLFRTMSTAFDMALRTAPDKEDAIVLNRETLEAVSSGDLREVDLAMDRHMAYLENIAEETFGRKRIRDVPPFLVGLE